MSAASQPYVASAKITPARAPPAAPHTFMTRSDAPCTPGALTLGTDSVSSVEPATSPQDQPSPSRNSPTPSRTASSAAAVPLIAHATSSSTAPTTRSGWRPKRSEARPTSGDSAYIPSTWTLITSPMTTSDTSTWRMWIGVMTMTDTIAVCATAIAARPSTAPREARTTVRECRRAGRGAGGAPIGCGARASSEQRVGAQRRCHDERREAERDQGEQVAAGELGQPEVHRDPPRGVGQVGSGDRADGGGPDDGRQVTGAVLRLREVRRRVPGLQAGCGSRAGQQEPQEQQGEPARHSADDDERRADAGDGQTCRETDPSAPPVGDAHERQCRDGGAHHAGGRRQAGGSLRAGQPRGEQPADGHSGTDAEPAEHLRAAQGDDGAALHPVGGPGVGEGHVVPDHTGAVAVQYTCRTAHPCAAPAAHARSVALSPAAAAASWPAQRSSTSPASRRAAPAPDTANGGSYAAAPPAGVAPAVSSSARNRSRVARCVAIASSAAVRAAPVRTAPTRPYP